MQEYIIPINSIFANTYTSNSNFVYQLPFSIDNVKWIELISGDIPITPERMLLYDIGESNNKRVHSSNSRYDGVLRYNHDDFTNTSNRIFLTHLNKKHIFSKVNIKKLSTMSIKLYRYDDEIVTFTNPGMYNIANITAIGTTTARIETTINHNLNLNDVVYLRDIDNMSTVSFSKAINNKFTVTNIAAVNRFDIALNISTEAVNQCLTGYGQTYTFGSHAIVRNSTNGEIAVTGITQHVNGSLIQLAQNHGLTIGDTIKIHSMDNGATQSDNNQINNQHVIYSTPTLSSLVIPIFLSAYPLITVAKTGSPTPFLLGSHGKVYPEKNQTYLEFLIRSDGKVKELSDKLSSPGPSSIWTTDGYKNRYLYKKK